MGIKVAGSLGNAQELEMSYAIWEKNVVYPERETAEEIGQELMHIGGIEGIFNVKGYKLLGEEIIEGEDSQVNKTAEILSAMSPLLANKILESLTVNEVRDLASLGRIDGGDSVASETQEGTEAAQFAAQLFKNLK